MWIVATLLQGRKRRGGGGGNTLPSTNITNIAPVGGYLEDYFPFLGTPCQVHVGGSEGILLLSG